MIPDPEILFERRGSAGLVTLNRPHALNAVTRDMVRALRAQLEAWRHDGDVTRIVVVAAGRRAFSAGGDLRRIYELGRAGRQDESLGFWREEYALNTAIKRYPKPYVALIDGIVMGGGVGISVHGSHRVAGDHFQFAMPEVGIGFFPDVGATFFLPRLPGRIGTYCALTGERLNAADGIAAGVATDRVASARFAELTDALCDAAPVDATLAKFRSISTEAAPALSRTADGFVGAGFKPAPTQRRTADGYELIDRIFAPDRVEDILRLLDSEAQADAKTGDAVWARATANTIRAKAPLSLKIALAQMRRGGIWSFEECMRAEFRIVSRVVFGEDFYEGIRAVIIDKDNQPRWRPARLDEVTGHSVEGHFAPLDTELVLP